MKGKKDIIFKITGKFPLLQLLAIILFGTAAIYFAGNIQVGAYESIKAPIEKYGDEYRLDVAVDQSVTLDSSVSINWCFDQFIGKQYSVEKRAEADGMIFVLNTDTLDKDEYAHLDAGNTLVYAEYKKSTKPLFDWWQR